MIFMVLWNIPVGMTVFPARQFTTQVFPGMGAAKTFCDQAVRVFSLSIVILSENLIFPPHSADFRAIKDKTCHNL